MKPSGRIPVRCVVKDGQAADAVVEAIAQYHPSMLVAGVKRSSDSPGPHGTAFALLARSRVPVLCVPPGLAVETAEAGVFWNGADQQVRQLAPSRPQG